ncbi:hypothetical protein J2S89_002525 [Arthrobacter bambusae]|nr:hypothetical protein [Arthrobacter bambusae]MDQ0099022.1 hypothetical protein [Arthrobacter bambusae]
MAPNTPKTDAGQEAGAQQTQAHPNEWEAGQV